MRATLKIRKKKMINHIKHRNASLLPYSEEDQMLLFESIALEKKIYGYGKITKVYNAMLNGTDEELREALYDYFKGKVSEEILYCIKSNKWKVFPISKSV